DQDRAFFHGGRLLQHALYALVAEQLVGQPVTRAAYYFPAPHAQRPSLSFEPPDPRALRQILDDVLEPARSGSFTLSHAPNVDCKYCDFRPACRGEQASAARTVCDQMQSHPDQFVAAAGKSS